MYTVSSIVTQIFSSRKYMRFVAILPIPSLVLSPRKGFPCDVGYEIWSKKLLEFLGYRKV